MPSPKTSTQQYLPISAVYDDVLVTKKAQFVQVVMVNSVNFGLKSEEEQNAIIYQYQSFINSLSFPIQIVMHSKRLDLTAYIKNLQARITQEANELIRYQIQEYVDFVEKLISIANIMDKKFFIIVPYILPANEVPKGGLLSTLFGGSHVHLKVPLSRFLKVKEELSQRTNVIMSGLASMGISSQVLNTKQLIELFYRTYNPEEAMKEKLQGEIEAIGTQVAPPPTTSGQSAPPAGEASAQKTAVSQEQAPAGTTNIPIKKF